LIKNSQPFGKKFQKTVGGIFLTHTVYCEQCYVTWTLHNMCHNKWRKYWRQNFPASNFALFMAKKGTVHKNCSYFEV